MGTGLQPILITGHHALTVINALLHHEDLLVGMLMQLRAASRRRVYDKERDADITVVVSLELVRGLAVTGIGALSISGHLELWHIFVFVACFGVRACANASWTSHAVTRVRISYALPATDWANFFHFARLV